MDPVHFLWVVHLLSYWHPSIVGTLGIPRIDVLIPLRLGSKVLKVSTTHLFIPKVLRLTGKRDRLIGCVEKESILDKDISTCLPVSLNYLGWNGIL